MSGKRFVADLERYLDMNLCWNNVVLLIICGTLLLARANRLLFCALTAAMVLWHLTGAADDVHEICCVGILFARNEIEFLHTILIIIILSMPSIMSINKKQPPHTNST